MKAKVKRKPVYIENRKAKFDYQFLEVLTAGIVLQGSEVKSIRDGRVNLMDSFCYFEQDALWTKNLELTPTVEHYAHEPKRPRKLLLKKKELLALSKNLVQGTTIVIVAIEEVRGRFKVKIALARGKKNYDKRETLKERDAAREIKNVNNL